MLRTIANSRHLKTQFTRLAQLAYYQAGKIVVQTLLPEHPPTALISLNFLGITTATGADTYIPIDSSSRTHWCSSLESRLIGLYGGKATSSLLESQYAAIWKSPKTKLTTNDYRPLDTIAGSLNNELKVQQNGIESNVLQSDIGNLEIQIATQLAVTMINEWNLYSLKNIAIRKDHITSVTKILNTCYNFLYPSASFESIQLYNPKGLLCNASGSWSATKDCLVEQKLLNPEGVEKTFSSQQRFPSALDTWSMVWSLKSIVLPPIVNQRGSLVAKKLLRYNEAFVTKPIFQTTKSKEVFNNGAKKLSFGFSYPAGLSKVPAFFLPDAPEGVKASLTPLGLRSRSTPIKAELFRKKHIPLWVAKHKQQINTGKSPVKSNTGWANYFIGNSTKTKFITFPYQPTLIRQINVGSKNNQTLFLESHLRYFKLPMLLSYPLPRRGTNRRLYLVDVSRGKQEKVDQPFASTKFKGKTSENLTSHFNLEKQPPSVSWEKVYDTNWLYTSFDFVDQNSVNHKNAVKNDYIKSQNLEFTLWNNEEVLLCKPFREIGEDVKFLLSSQKNSWSLNGDGVTTNAINKVVAETPITKSSLAMPQRFLLNEHRTLAANVVKKNVSRINVFQLVNPIQFSNVQRNRFYPSWFRLYLPDIEVTEFIKNVANYYFSLGLQTLTRPSLNEFNFLLRSLGSGCNIKSSIYSSSAAFFFCKTTDQPEGVRGISFHSAGPERERLDKGAYTLLESEDCSIKQFPDSKLSKTRFLRHIKAESLSPLIVGPTVPFYTDFLLRGSGSRLALLQRKESSITLIQNVFFCGGDNNLSIGIGLLRHAARRRSQQNVKKHYLVINKPEGSNGVGGTTLRGKEQIFKKVSYPKLAVALWGFSRPWHFNHFINLGFRQKTIQPLTKNSKVLQNNSLRSSRYSDDEQLSVARNAPSRQKGITSGYPKSCSMGKDQKRDVKNTLVQDNVIDTTLWYKLTTAKCYSSLDRLFDRRDKKIDIRTPLGKSYNALDKANDQTINDAQLYVTHNSEKRVHNVDSDTQNLLEYGQVHMQPLKSIDKQANHQNNLDSVSLESKVFDDNLLSTPIPNPEKVVDLRSMLLTPFGSSDFLSTFYPEEVSQLMTPKELGFERKALSDQKSAYTPSESSSATKDCSTKPKGYKSSWCNSSGSRRLLHKSLGKTIKQKKSKFTPLDLSFSSVLEKQVFPAGFSNISVMEKEFVSHALIINSFAKAFFLVDQNRQLIDYFADYLIRFQILRQHQILHLFSAILLRCKKET